VLVPIPIERAASVRNSTMVAEDHPEGRSPSVTAGDLVSEAITTPTPEPSPYQYFQVYRNG